MPGAGNVVQGLSHILPEAWNGFCESSKPSDICKAVGICGFLESSRSLTILKRNMKPGRATSGVLQMPCPGILLYPDAQGFSPKGMASLVVSVQLLVASAVVSCWWLSGLAPGCPHTAACTLSCWLSLSFSLLCQRLVPKPKIS